MNEILTEIWIQSIIIGSYIEHSSHAPAIFGMFGVLLLVVFVLATNLKRNS